MKRILALALTLVMLLSLAACGGDNTSAPDTTAPDASTPSTGGKGEVYDGYSTWWGSFEPYERESGTRYFTHEDICE